MDNNGINHLSTGAGFLPSTVATDSYHLTYPFGCLDRLVREAALAVAPQSRGGQRDGLCSLRWRKRAGQRRPEMVGWMGTLW